MNWTILTSYLSGMPQEFESLSIKDAEVIMQAWADAKRTRSDRPEIGKLHWIIWNGIETCTAFFHRGGKQNYIHETCKEG